MNHTIVITRATHEAEVQQAYQRAVQSSSPAASPAYSQSGIKYSGAQSPARPAAMDTSTLHVNVMAGRRLAAADTGGTSDPFVVAELVDVVTGKPLQQSNKLSPPRRPLRTKPLKKTLDPVWPDGEVTWAMLTENLAELALKVTVFDSDAISFHDPLGQVTIPLAPTVDVALLTSGEARPPQTVAGVGNAGTCQWYALEDAGKEVKASGDVRVFLRAEVPPVRVGASRGLANFRRLGKRTIMHNRILDRSHHEVEKKEAAARRVDMLLYAVFMLFFTLNTIDGLGDASPYSFTKRLVATLKLSEFERVTDPAQLNAWLEGSLVQGIYSGNFEGSGTASGPANPGLLDDGSASSGWVVQGPVRVAQLRSDTFDCKGDMHPFVKRFPYACTRSRRLTYSTSAFDDATESTSAFRGFTYDHPLVEPVSYQRQSMAYTSYETAARHVFPAPAYAVLLDSHQAQSDAQALASKLASARYVDRQTNLVVVDLSVYNYVLDMTTWVRASAEFNAAGGVDATYTVQPVQLMWGPNAWAFKVVMSSFVGLGYAYFGGHLVWRMCSKQEGPFVVLREVMTYITLINILFYVLQLGFRYQSYSLCMGGFLAETSIGAVDFLGPKFIDFRPPVKAMQWSVTFQSMNAFLNWFKLVSYLAKYPVFALMTKTLECAMDELSAFGVVFCIVMFGFAQAHSMFFGKQLENYDTISSSFLTLFRAMLGDFNFSETYELHYVIGPLFFITFVGIAFLVVLNIIIAIIADAYVDANADRKTTLRKRKLKAEAELKDKQNRQRHLREAKDAQRAVLLKQRRQHGAAETEPPHSGTALAHQKDVASAAPPVESSWVGSGTAQKRSQVTPFDDPFEEVRVVPFEIGQRVSNPPPKRKSVEEESALL